MLRVRVGPGREEGLDESEKGGDVGPALFLQLNGSDHREAVDGNPVEIITACRA